VSCLPVTSYGGYGHQKRNIRLREHGHIYSKNVPRSVEGMLSRPLKVKLSRGVDAQDLTEPSLVNYGKIYTVETNVKVKDVGELDSESKGVLQHYFRRVYLGEYSDPIPDTPTQSNAALAYVGGAASSLPQNPQSGYPEASIYPASTESDPPRVYPSTAPAPGYPTGYPMVSSTEAVRYSYATADIWQKPASGYQNPRADYQSQFVQAAPAYSVATATGYTSAPTYAPIPRSAEDNTTSSYYPPPQTPYPSDSRYPAYGNPQHGTPSIPRTTDPYRYPTAGDPYFRQSEGPVGPSTTPYSGGYSNASSAAYQGFPPQFSASVDRDEDIRLTTVEEEASRRRRESDAAPARDRDRRRRR